MPRFVEQLSLDSQLFKFSVGRIELNLNDAELLFKNPTIYDILKQAYSSGFRLIYVYYPTVNILSNNNSSDAVSQLPLLGNLVDRKTTYSSPLKLFDKNELCERAFLKLGSNIRIRKYQKLSDPKPSSTLRNLAIASGVWSRFKIDTKIPTAGFEAMFEAWITNSLNGTLADEVFIAYDMTSGGLGVEVAFITVKCRGNSVNIGLLSVAESHRRLGIGKSLLSRAVLWALEEIGYDPAASINVVTQGSNDTACKCYESFGFSLSSTQNIHHVWLPENIVGPVSRADHLSIPFCRQHITGMEQKYIQEVFSKGLDSASHFTLMCSGRLQEIVGPASQRVVMVPSGTAALEMAALLCDLQPGDEVIMPSYTFSSTANAFVLRGAVPVFVDIRAETLNIDETLIEQAITPRTRVICAVHYAGLACEMDTICDIAKKHNLLVVEDAAQAFLSTYKGRQCGSIGDFGCFSFHYTKNVICGEGGALSVNNSAELARRALVLWEKGTNRYDFMMGKVDRYHWVDIGSSYVPSEISCAILWAQLDACQQVTNMRRQFFDEYQLALSKGPATAVTGESSGGIAPLRLPHIPPHCQTNAHIFYILTRNKTEREYFESELRKKGVSAFTHYVPLHSAPAGMKYCRSVGSMEVTDRVFETLLRIPVWPDLSMAERQFVVDCLQTVAAALQAEEKPLVQSKST